MNGQELWVPRSLARAGGTQKTADAEKEFSTEKTSKQTNSTNQCLQSINTLMHNFN